MEQVISGGLILAGAAIMLVSMIKWRQLSQVTPLIPERSRDEIIRYLKLHGLLMTFFLLAYIGVAIVLFVGIPVVGELMVGIILLGGAFFVLLGIVIEMRMLMEIQVTIRGLLPVCSHCKRVRHEGEDPAAQESWSDIESYISERTGADISHSLCPSCKKELYPDLK